MTDQLHLIDAPEWGPAAVDLLAGSRDVEWIYELVHARTNRFIRTLRGVRDFRFENNVHATIRSGGSCTWQGAEDIDWMEHRLRAHQRISHRGQSLQWTVGTFIVESPTRVLTDKTRGAQELQLFDAMYRLDVQTSTVSEWVARKGSNIVGTVRYLLDRQGLKHALEDSAEVFASQMSWEAGTTYLRMVNDMLAAANFTAIYADPQGVLRAGPARSPLLWRADFVEAARTWPRPPRSPASPLPWGADFVEAAFRVARPHRSWVSPLLWGADFVEA